MRRKILLTPLLLMMLFALALPALAAPLAASSAAPHTHKFSKWVLVRKATPFKRGLKKRVCYGCKRAQYKVIEKRKLTLTERRVQAITVKYLTAAKRYDRKTMNRCFANQDSDYEYPEDRTFVKYFRSYNKKMLNWEIVGIARKGKEYRVYINVTRPNYYRRIYKTAYKEYSNRLDRKKNPYRGTDEAAEKVEEKLKYGPRGKKTEREVIPLIRSHGKWMIKERSRDIVDIAACYYNSAMEDALNKAISDYIL